MLSLQWYLLPNVRSLSAYRNILKARPFRHFTIFGHFYPSLFWPQGRLSWIKPHSDWDGIKERPSKTKIVDWFFQHSTFFCLGWIKTCNSKELKLPQIWQDFSFAPLLGRVMRKERRLFGETSEMVLMQDNTRPSETDTRPSETMTRQDSKKVWTK